MKKNYVKPAIKAANILINSQLLVGSGSDPDPVTPDQNVDIPFVGTIEDEGYAD